MSEHMIFQNCPPWQKDSIRSYWERKLPRIDRLLQHFPEDQRELRLTIRHNSIGFDARIVLQLPTGTLVAEESSKTDFSAIDLAVDRLTAEIRRHKGRLRHDDGYRRKHHRRETFRHAAVLLESDIRTPDRETFFEWLRPVMDRLKGQTHHELAVAQLRGQVKPGQFVVADILDEVIIRAWAQFQEKELTEPLEVWLVRLLHQVLDEQVSAGPATVSIYDRNDNAPVDDLERTAQGDRPTMGGESPGDEPPPVTLDDVLPDHHVAEPWEAMAAQEQMKWVLTQLSTVSPRQRRAFTLHLLDGLDPDEIAMIQGRAAERVRADIREVQQLLRERLDRTESADPVPAQPSGTEAPE